MGNVEAETVADTLKEVHFALFYITLGDVHGEAPGHNLVVTLADTQAEKLGDILCNVEAEALVHTQTGTVGEASQARL